MVYVYSVLKMKSAFNHVQGSRSTSNRFLPYMPDNQLGAFLGGIRYVQS